MRKKQKKRRKRVFQKSDLPKAEQARIVKQAEYLREILGEFGATLVGFDPGVTAHIQGEPVGMVGRSGSGYWGEHLHFSRIQWDWLRPLLEELRGYRRIAKHGAAK